MNYTLAVPVQSGAILYGRTLAHCNWAMNAQPKALSWLPLYVESLHWRAVQE